MSTTASSSSPRNQTASSPPPSISSPRLAPTTTITTPSSQPTGASTLPSSRQHITEARRAVVASLSNMLDTSLQPRAAILHDNAAALNKQEKDVMDATAGLRRESEKLAREAGRAAKKIKETGNVQNWAEVLEREFLVLEETMRLARDGSCSCSCSDCGGSDGDERSERGSVDGDDGEGDEMDKGKDVDVNMVDSGTAWSMSDASKSMVDVDSSTGTGKARGSETGSMSTTP